MNLLCTLSDSDIFPNVTNNDPTEFRHRRAARAVVSDEMGRIMLLHVSKLNYHKLPGGGLEGDEEVIEALGRELLEETGCVAEIYEEIGETIEHRNIQEMNQASYAYLGRIIGEQVEPIYTDSEKAAGFQVQWARNIDEAISILETDETDDYGGAFMLKRDLAILNTAKAILSQKKL